MKIIKTLLISTTLIISNLIGAHAESTLDKIMKTGTLKLVQLEIFLAGVLKIQQLMNMKDSI